MLPAIDRSGAGYVENLGCAVVLLSTHHQCVSFREEEPYTQFCKNLRYDAGRLPLPEPHQKTRESEKQDGSIISLPR